MDINELQSYRLSDAVKFNDRLNPRLWGEDEHLLPEVRSALLKIAEDFKEFLGVTDLEVVDITISGSNAAYTYTPHSDIDLHLVVDLPRNNDDVYRELFNAKKYQYNDQHDYTIGGYDVELYVQNAAEPHVSQGIYSVLDNDWIRVPNRRRPTVDDISVQSKYEDLGARIENAMASQDLEAMDRLTDKIKNMRKSGLATTGEFGPENLAFKLLRANGELDRLRDARLKAKDQLMSLAERKKKKRKKKVKYAYGGYWYPAFSWFGGTSGESGEGGGDGGGGGESVHETVMPQIKWMHVNTPYDFNVYVADGPRAVMVAAEQVPLPEQGQWFDFIGTLDHEGTFNIENFRSIRENDAANWDEIAVAVEEVRDTVQKMYGTTWPEIEAEMTGGMSVDIDEAVVPGEDDVYTVNILRKVLQNLEGALTVVHQDQNLPRANRLLRNAQYLFIYELDGDGMPLRNEIRYNFDHVTGMTEVQPEEFDIQRFDSKMDELLGYLQWLLGQVADKDSGLEIELDESKTEITPELVKRFVRSCAKNLKLRSVPRIRLHRDGDWSEKHGTFGRFDHDSDTIELATHGRHVLDVLRTLAHELTHARQNEISSLPADAGQTGSPYEDHANAMAGRIMRHWADNEPELFHGVDLESLLQEGFADIIPNSAKRAILAMCATAGLSGCVTMDNLRTVQTLGRAVQTMERYGVEGAQEELTQELKNYLRAKQGDPGAQNLSHIYRAEQQARQRATQTQEPFVPGRIKSRLPAQEPTTKEDYDPNGPPPGPEFRPTMPAGTARVDVSDVYDWYKLGQHISNLKGLGRHDFGQGPPSAIIAFGSEDAEHKYIKDLEKTGLTTTDIDPAAHKKGPKQKVDPTFNVAESSGYIPVNDREARDPRYSMAITQDIKPGEVQRQARKMGFKTDAAGRPPLLMKSVQNLLEEKLEADLANFKESCWTGYRQAGMKKKGRRQVPNCVPVKEYAQTPGSGDGSGSEPNHERLRQLAAAWWNALDTGYQDMIARQLLMLGWNIGPVESGDEDARLGSLDGVWLSPVGEYGQDWDDRDVISFSAPELGRRMDEIGVPPVGPALPLPQDRPRRSPPWPGPGEQPKKVFQVPGRQK